MQENIYKVIDALLQEDLEEAFKVYQKVKVQDENFDVMLEQALITYGNTAKNRILQLKKMSIQGSQIMYAVIHHVHRGIKEELLVVADSEEKAKEYVSKHQAKDVLVDKGHFHIISIMKYE